MTYAGAIPIIELNTISFNNPQIMLNKIYANFIVHDGGTKPTEKQCTDGLKALQDAWDLENDSYKSKRKAEYPRLEEQLDDIYHNGIDGWKATIKAIKDKYPKL